MVKGLLALLAGSLSALSFAPFAWWPLALLAFFILFALWEKDTLGRAVWHGFLYGLGLFGVGISWMYVSIHTFGGMPPIIAGFCIFVLVCFMSLYPAAVGLLQSLFRSYSPLGRFVFIMPALWVLVEWIRGWFLTGLPWLSSGYAFIDTPIASYAPMGGVYLLSLISTVTVGAVAYFFLHGNSRNIAVILIPACVWGGGVLIDIDQWTQPAGEPIDVAIVQNNVPIMEKWDALKSQAIVDEYLSVSKQQQDVDLIVWPEAAVPDYRDNLPLSFWQTLKNHPAEFVFGALDRKQIEDGWAYYNSVVASNGTVSNVYRKQHLVPFGEYFPLQGILAPLIELLDIPMSDFSAWTTEQKPINVSGQPIAITICFEDAFPDESRHQIPNSTLLLNVSEDIWFGDSFAPHQRLQMARFRSLESGRPMIRSSNNGLSSLIDAQGRVQVVAGQFVNEVVTGVVTPRTGVTPYILIGNIPIIYVSLFLLITGLLFGKTRRR